MTIIRRGKERCRLRLACWLVVFLVSGSQGCSKGGPVPQPEAKDRLTKVLRLYQVYVEKNKKGPPDEQTLKEFGKKLTPKDREDYLLGEDLENIFTSPRDNQKYVIQYNLKLSPSGPTRAVAWEANGQNGMRYVALNIGYVEEYDENTFKQYKK